MIEFDAQHKISVDLSIDEVADTLDPEFEENDDWCRTSQASPQRPRIDPVIGQLEAAGVPEHVGVHLDPKVRCDAGALDRTVEAFRRQRGGALS
jgi:hypothetical protein